MNEVEICPFCGSEATVAKIMVSDTLYAVYCSADENYCYIRPSTKVYKTREEAIKAWNRRVERDNNDRSRTKK